MNDAACGQEIIRICDLAQQFQERSIKLMMIHARKGLEFPTVFIPGLEYLLKPHQAMSVRDGSANVDEARLLYMEMIRAIELEA
ncbi:MAG: 3'-5' exonuclease [Cyanobacteria bacterium P01_H01_bin.153]